MTEVDTSSYPKPSLPVSPLDIAGKVGSLQQQQLSINQAKLDQANQGLSYMTRAMGSIGPNAKSVDDYIGVANNAVKMGLVPENMLNVFVDRAKAANSPQDFYKEFMSAAADHQQQIQMHTGINTEKNDNANTYQGKTDVLTGGFTSTTKLPVQNPPGTHYFDKDNQEVLTPPAGPPGVMSARPSGVVPVPQPRPGAMSVAPPPTMAPQARTTGPTGATIETTGGPGSPPATVAQRIEAAQPQPLKAGPSPLFAEGKDSYTKDQLSASARSQAIKPAIQALKLMPGISTGPGTEQITHLVATAKALGLVDIGGDTDPTVIRQEINKKLAQYVGSSPLGQRSDAQQALAESGSPSAKTQILPALQNLTRDAIALDRVKILQPQAFKGTDYQNYIKHQGNFPGGIDEKALTLDLLPEAERNKLIKDVVTKYKANPSDKAANRFLDTLKLAKEHGIYEGT